MNDTLSAVADRYRALLMARSGSERLRMACDMFESARRMVMAGLSGDPANTAERRVGLFLRLYGADFDAPARERIIARIREDGGTDTPGRAAG